MLLVNLSSSLVSGQCGEVKGFGENYVEVFFPQLKKTVKIHSYNFSVYSKELHRDVASRRQIPLKLAFAMTTHKAQGLTLDRIEIDCKIYDESRANRGSSGEMQKYERPSDNKLL